MIVAVVEVIVDELGAFDEKVPTFADRFGSQQSFYWQPQQNFIDQILRQMIMMMISSITSHSLPNREPSNKFHKNVV